MPSGEIRLVALFDAQNVYRTASDVYGFQKRCWDYDPRKLVEAAVRQMPYSVKDRIVATNIRFYTGVPSFTRHATGRKYWERLFTRFRNDGMTVVWRELR